MTRRFDNLDAAVWHEFRYQLARQRGDDEAAIRHHDEMTACRLASQGSPLSGFPIGSVNSPGDHF